MKYYDVNLSITDIIYEEVCVKGGGIDISGDEDLKFVAMVNRYKGNKNVALGLIQAAAKRTVPLFARLCKKQ